MGWGEITATGRNKGGVAAADSLSGRRYGVCVLVGLSMFWVWTWLRSWGPSMSLWEGDTWATNLSFRVDHVACATMLAFVMVFSRVSRLRNALASLTMCGASLCASCGVGIACALALGWDGGSVSGLGAAAVLSGLLTGCARGLLLCLWGSALIFFDIREALRINFGALVLSAVVYYACCMVGEGAELTLGLVSALLGPFAAAPYTVRAHGSTTAGWPRAKSSSRVAVEGKAGRSLVLAAFVFGVANGFVAGIYEMLPHDGGHLFSYGRIPATIAAAALAYVAVKLLGRRLTNRVMQICVPIVALAFLILPYEVQPTFGRFFGILGYHFLMNIFWIVVSPYPFGRNLSVPTASVGLFALVCGAPIGFLVWDLAGGAETSWSMQAVSAIAMFALVMLEVCCAAPGSEGGGCDTAKKGVSEEPCPSAARDDGGSFDVDAAETLARRFGLTVREVEVCRLLGRGRSRQYIADSLGVSLQTARTHVTNVYRKLQVHTQQEFLDLYEAAGTKRDAGPLTTSG